MKRFLRWSLLALLTLLLTGVPQASAQPKNAQELAVAANDVLTNYGCYKCHGDGKLRGDLNLRDLKNLLAQKGQKIIRTDAPKESEFIKRIQDQSMPATGTLPKVKPADADVLVRWIAAGAPAVNQKPPEKLTPLVFKKESSVSVTEVFRSRCYSCHGPDKKAGGPQGNRQEASLNIFDRARLVNRQIIIPKNAADSELYRRIAAEDVDSVMPPPGNGRGRLTTEEVAAVRDWINKGAALETFILTGVQERGEEYVLASILKDVRTLKDPTNYRYFSFNHLLAQDVTPEALESHRQALTLMVNSLSREPNFERPQPIEGTGTVLRVDIRKLGWDQRPFRILNKVRRQELGKSNISLFDLLLLEYPYALFSASSPTYQKLLQEFLEPADQVAPVAYIRGDWFINVAGRPPLYEDMLQLPPTLPDLEKMLGVNADDDVAQGRARRVGLANSGISKNNRVIERHTGKNTPYYWKSYDFGTSRGQHNIFRDPIDLKPSGGEMIWGLPNGLQAYSLNTGSGARLEAAPTEIVIDAYAADKTVRNGLSCIRCHEKGMWPARDDVRRSLENLGKAPFDLAKAQALYADQKEIDELQRSDARRYQDAVKLLFNGKPPASISAILEQSARRFQDESLSLKQALAELGEAEPDKAQNAFGANRLAAVGLAQVAFGGVVRRDTWEDSYDQVVRESNRGQSLVPLDSISRLDYQSPDSPRIELELHDGKTGKKKTTFIPDDTVFLVVKNLSSSKLTVDVVGIGSRGLKSVLLEGGKVAAGEELRVPPKGAYRIKPGTGREQFSVLASRKDLPEPILLGLDDTSRQQGLGMADRVVHPFYKLQRGGNVQALSFDPANVVKKTIEQVVE